MTYVVCTGRGKRRHALAEVVVSGRSVEVTPFRVPLEVGEDFAIEVKGDAARAGHFVMLDDLPMAADTLKCSHGEHSFPSDLARQARKARPNDVVYADKGAVGHIVRDRTQDA